MTTATPVPMQIDLDEFSLGELSDICMAAGIDPEQAKSGEIKIGMQMVPALYWILKRRSAPDFTLEQARNAKASEFLELAELVKAAASRPNPTQPRKPSPRKRTS